MNEKKNLLNMRNSRLLRTKEEVEAKQEFIDQSVFTNK